MRELEKALLTKENIKTWRESLGLSRAELAKKLGLSPYTIIRWENPGDKNMPTGIPKMVYMAALAKTPKGQALIEELAEGRLHKDVLTAEAFAPGLRIFGMLKEVFETEGV